MVSSVFCGVFCSRLLRYCEWVVAVLSSEFSRRLGPRLAASARLVGRACDPSWSARADDRDIWCSYLSQRFRRIRSPPPSYVRLQVTSAPEYRAARNRPASSRGNSSHNDPHGDEKRESRAGSECRLAVVRAIVVELSPVRWDGAPRGLDASSRGRDCTTTCGSFAFGLWTRPEDARGPVWHAPTIGGELPPWLVAFWRHTIARYRVFLA